MSTVGEAGWVVRAGAGGPAYLFASQRAARVWAARHPRATTFLFPVFTPPDVAGATPEDAAPA